MVKPQDKCKHCRKKYVGHHKGVPVCFEHLPHGAIFDGLRCNYCDKDAVYNHCGQPVCEEHRYRCSVCGGKATWSEHGKLFCDTHVIPWRKYKPDTNYTLFEINGLEQSNKTKITRTTYILYIVFCIIALLLYFLCK